MLLLGIDIGTSSIKVSVIDSNTKACIASAQFPETETAIVSHEPGWAEQNPDMWWFNVKAAILKVNRSGKFNPKDICAIGIAYQMHGLVLIDKCKNVLRDSIIWCDSRSVEIGNKAFNAIGEQKCLTHLLNSPGNFTASKLAWVKQNERKTYDLIDQVLLPGDFISMKFTGELTTSISALSEGIFWDFKNKELSKDIMSYFSFNHNLFPERKNVFESHGFLTAEVAGLLSMNSGIPVSYKAGDQPNNALSLNVLEPGEVAATAGTSGVIYGVTDEIKYDQFARVNTFAHVNHTESSNRLGVLLCINGTGILNRWIQKIAGNQLSYNQINEMASQVAIGSQGLKILPFGNGAERILCNKTIGAHVLNIGFNTHTNSHLFRAVQEGIAFALRYGLDIMRSNGINPSIIKAGKTNMFLSEVFTDSFVNATNVPLALSNCDGSIGAAMGAGIGAKIYKDSKEAFGDSKPILYQEPTSTKLYEELYSEWKYFLEKQIVE